MPSCSVCHNGRQHDRGMYPLRPRSCATCGVLYAPWSRSPNCILHRKRKYKDGRNRIGWERQDKQKYTLGIAVRIMSGEVSRAEMVQDKQGYLRYKGLLVHRLMWMAHHGWLEGRKWQVHHKDGNRLNYAIENLSLRICAEHGAGITEQDAIELLRKLGHDI